MNLVDPGTLKSFLARHGVSASKGLGQHFLCSRSTVESIVATVADCKGILEIGPGPGVLTSPLSECSEKLIALEIDARMVSALAESAPRADLRQVDVLKADLLSILQELPEPRAIVSNMPYYITGPLLTRFAEAKQGWSRAVLMMQKEVADRIQAKPGNRDRGSLSVFLQSQFEIRLVTQVPRGCFYPPPKVDSTVLELTPNGKDRSDAFYRVVRQAFTQPRKTLANNLAAGLHIPRDVILDRLALSGLSEMVRPQALTMEQWEHLVEVLSAGE